MKTVNVIVMEINIDIIRNGMTFFENPVSPFSLSARYASIAIVRMSLFSAILVNFALGSGCFLPSVAPCCCVG